VPEPAEPEPAEPEPAEPEPTEPEPTRAEPTAGEAAVTAPTVREATGTLRVLPVPAVWSRRSLPLVERHARVYRHAWMMFASGLLEPLFYLLSIGIGLGKLVGTVTGPGGHPVLYTAFVAPALLASSSMNGAIFDSTYNIFFRLKYAKLYDAALATPMRAADVAIGEVTWALIRGGLYACAFMVIMLAMGLVHSAWAVFDVPVALLIGFAFAATGMAGTTFMKSWQHFEFIMLASLPMFLFSASFYPLTVYPQALRVVVECTPLYQGVALLRDLTLGAVGPVLLLHALYLAVMGLAGLTVATRRIGHLLLR
jgi:lipooligosaccharide transport system permease protein